MIAAGLVEVWLGVNAEQKPLEEIATPLTAEDAGQPAAEDAGRPAPIPAGAGTAVATGTGQHRQRRRIEPAVTPQAAYRHWSPMFPPYSVPLVDTARGREVEAIVAALAGEGSLDRPQLARLVHAGQWGPGRFTPALRQAVALGKVHRTSRGRYALTASPQDPGDHLPAGRQR
jgi:hypothetical protein